jgi:AhpD family alkylhydroperoxidase
MNTKRVSMGEAAPELYQAVYAMDGLVKTYAAKAGIDEAFAELLELRASQLNGCAFCLKMHSELALKAGVSPEKLSVLSAWRETTYFSKKEEAALELIEAVTLIHDGQVSDVVYAAASATLTDEEIAAVEWLGVIISAWNRIAIPSRMPVEP